MPTIDDVYRQFGQAAEAAQLLETNLGTLLIFLGVVDKGLITATLEVDGVAATAVMDGVNRQTLGQMIRNTQRLTDALGPIEHLLADGLDARNRLSHSFYRHHNLRRNSEAGRGIMLEDLESIHQTILAAWKAVSRLLGVDLDALVEKATAAEPGTSAEEGSEPPLTHLPI